MLTDTQNLKHFASIVCEMYETNDFAKYCSSSKNDIEFLDNMFENIEVTKSDKPHASSKNVSGFCSVCSSKTTKRCSKCKMAWYCCRECQVNDWNEHKLICKAV